MPIKVAPRTCSIAGCNGKVKARELCNPHYMDAWRMNELPPGPRRTQDVSDPMERWLAKVDKNGPVPESRPDLGPCWVWLAGKNKHGYGRFGPGRRGDLVWNAHRWGYVQLIGPVDANLDLDHLCRVRHCVNPAHLEPVTPQENVRRGAAGRGVCNADGFYVCRNGHVLTPENSRPRGDCAVDACRACGREASRRFREAKKSVTPP